MARQLEVYYRPGAARGDQPVRVVVDVLRATSTIVTALASGAAAVVPVRDNAAALARRGPDTIIGGERDGLPFAGFDRGNSPREYQREVAGRTVILCTTNGTPALVAPGGGAARVLAASFLNRAAVSRRLAAAAGDVAVVCSGKEGGYSLEDAVAAGALADGFDGALGDGALIARGLWRHHQADLAGMLRSGNHGRYLIALGLDADLDFCAQLDRFDLVPELGGDGRITAGGAA